MLAGEPPVCAYAQHLLGFALWQNCGSIKSISDSRCATALWLERIFAGWLAIFPSCGSRPCVPGCPTARLFRSVCKAVNTHRSVANVQWLGFLHSPHKKDPKREKKGWRSTKPGLSESVEKGFSNVFNIHSWAINCASALSNGPEQQSPLLRLLGKSTKSIRLLIKSFWEINLTPKFLAIKLREASLAECGTKCWITGGRRDWEQNKWRHRWAKTMWHLSICA